MMWSSLLSPSPSRSRMSSAKQNVRLQNSAYSQFEHATRNDNIRTLTTTLEIRQHLSVDATLTEQNNNNYLKYKIRCRYCQVTRHWVRVTRNRVRLKSSTTTPPDNTLSTAAPTRGEQGRDAPCQNGKKSGWAWPTLEILAMVWKLPGNSLSMKV